MLPHLCGFIPNDSFAGKRTSVQADMQTPSIDSFASLHTFKSHLTSDVLPSAAAHGFSLDGHFLLGCDSFWPYVKPPMWCSTLEVFTKFGTASDKVFYVLSPRFLCRSISCRQPHLRIGSLLPSQLARLPVNAIPDPVANIHLVSFGVEFQRLLQRGCHIGG